MCYIHLHLALAPGGLGGGCGRGVGLHLFADADFAGDSDTKRSTSGVHLCIRGAFTCFPLNGVSKRQGCVSHSTPEAEIVAADFALRTEGIPALGLWTVLLRRPARITLHDDNQAMLRVCETGRNPTMKHLGRTHGVSVMWLHERYHEEPYLFQYIDTDQQAADVYTKGFADVAKWQQVCELVNVIDPVRFPTVAQSVMDHPSGDGGSGEPCFRLCGPWGLDPHVHSGYDLR